MPTTHLADGMVNATAYDRGTPRAVTGFPIHRGLSTSTVAFVDLLTNDGTIVYGAQVTPAALDGIQVAPMHAAATEAFLWMVADKNIGGWGSRCLAELAFREKQTAIQHEITRRATRRRPAANLVTAKAGAR